jgi:SAM-dependent methyltransferase
MSSAETWFATFAAGFGPLVRRLIERDAVGARVLKLEDNAVTFACGAEPRAALAYCRSLFRVLGERGAGPGPGPNPGPGAGRRGDASGLLAAAAASFARDPDALRGISAAGPRPRASRGAAGFALRAFGPDDPAPLPESARRGLEEAIARRSGGRPDPRGDPLSREYRLQARADGSVLFLERRGPVGGRAAEPPRPGELPRSTCRLLAEMTDPRPGDVFLDPFCGYGGIALERVLASPFRFVFASDIDPEKVEAVKAELREKAFERRRRTFFPKVRDALDPGAFEAGFIDAIATDPPWGLYEKGPEVDEAHALLLKFMGEAARLLGPGGRLVLLVGRGQSALAGDAAGGAFALGRSLEVLVSGKKASALRFDVKS